VILGDRQTAMYVRTRNGRTVARQLIVDRRQL